MLPKKELLPTLTFFRLESLQVTRPVSRFWLYRIHTVKVKVGHNIVLGIAGYIENLQRVGIEQLERMLQTSTVFQPQTDRLERQSTEIRYKHKTSNIYLQSAYGNIITDQLQDTAVFTCMYRWVTN